MRSVVSAVAVTLALSVGALAAPMFHFEMTKSAPAAGQKLNAAPARLQIWFTQVPAAGVSTITLKHGDADVELKKPVIDAKDKSITVEPVQPLTAGDYVAKWRGAGDDGHVMSGEVKFSIVSK